MCAQAVVTEDLVELEPILSELREAVSAQVGHVRRMVAEHTLRNRLDSGSAADQ